jgi:hypothetical protein
VFWSYRSFKYAVAGTRLGAFERRASVLDCGGPPPLFSRKPSHAKAAEGRRNPKPRGIFHPALKIGHNFIETALGLVPVRNFTIYIMWFETPLIPMRIVC